MSYRNLSTIFKDFGIVDYFIREQILILNPNIYVNSWKILI